MGKLDNIQVFAASVADIMDQLFRAFPMPSSLSQLKLEELYGPSLENFQPSVLHPDDPDYDKLLPYSFMVGTDLAYVAFEQDANNVYARKGSPMEYWPPEQRKLLQELRARVRDAEEIFGATIAFLLREAYIHEITPGDSGRKQPEYVLTSKGFAHLNKKFEGGTIREEFQLKAAARLLKTVKSGGDVAVAGKVLVDVLSTFLSPLS